jgi:hypothetical protein
MKLCSRTFIANPKSAVAHESLCSRPDFSQQCEQLWMDGGGRCGSVSAADERTQQPHFAFTLILMIIEVERLCHNLERIP